MSFDPSNPKNAESPALFPAENRRNMTRLQTLFEADHQFNDAAATNDGWHKIIHWIQQGSNPIDPLSPLTDAPSNAGGPPISWYQPDTYGVDRLWLRQKDGGNVTGTDGFNEIRINNFSVTTAQQDLVNPPDNTYGEIYTSFGVARGFYWKKAGICRSFTLSRNNFFSPEPPTITFGTVIIGTSPNIIVLGSSNVSADFRIIYRYI